MATMPYSDHNTNVGTTTATAESDGRSVAAMTCGMNATHSGTNPRASSQRTYLRRRTFHQFASTMQPRKSIPQSARMMSASNPPKPGKSTSLATSRHGK